VCGLSMRGSICQISEEELADAPCAVLIKDYPHMNRCAPNNQNPETGDTTPITTAISFSPFPYFLFRC
jgi:hypothetical protein